MRGFGAFFGKELRETVHTWRIWVLPAFILFAALSSPLITFLMPTLVDRLGGLQQGFAISVPDPTAAGAVRAMRWALQDARVDEGEVEYINAHGTSTPLNDSIETLAIKKLFGDAAHRIPISSTKSMLGHCMGASGAVEAIVCALTIHQGVIHPTINYQTPDPECDLDYVPNVARDASRRVRVALSNSFGLGGQNACLVLGAIS